MSYCDHLPFIVRPSVRRPSVNTFERLSSESPGPIFFKLYDEPFVQEGLKIYTNGHRPLIKMADMPIYGKITYKSSLPEPRKLQG